MANKKRMSKYYFFIIPKHPPTPTTIPPQPPTQLPYLFKKIELKIKNKYFL